MQRISILLTMALFLGACAGVENIDNPDATPVQEPGVDNQPIPSLRGFRRSPLKNVSCTFSSECTAEALEIDPPECLKESICFDGQCWYQIEDFCEFEPTADCAVAADCDDGQVCTTNVCVDGFCQFTPIEGCCTNNEQCDDDVFCNGVETCDVAVGDCQSGTPPDCDDTNACTADSCDEGEEACLNTPIDCDDGDACTEDSCDPATGECVNEDVAGCCTANADCNDDNECTTDACNLATNECSNTPIPGCGCTDDGDCDDGKKCTVDTCDDGACVHTDVVCNDNKVCTTDFCGAADGECYHPLKSNCGCAVDADCDDSNVCTLGEACVDETCQPGVPLGCPNDNDACTVDVCDHIDGCNNLQPPNCNDNDACTTDSCDEVQGCLHDPIPGCPGECEVDADCDDGLFCNGAETCNVETGVCQTGTPPTCDDGLNCTQDLCDEAADDCANPAVDCSDGDACTADTCDPVNGCEHDLIVCNDGDPCTVDVCNAALGCQAAPKPCDDGDPCTVDSCDPATGECVHTPAGVPCSDGLFCNGLETCDPATGECVAGTAPDCDDDVPCTVDSCSEVNDACVNDQLDCDDDNPCTTDSCNELTGECQHAAVICDDENPCTTDSCDPDTGACVNTPVVCDDGDLCNGLETCNVLTGLCQAGTPVECNDGVFCNGTETCDPDSGECVAGTAPDCNDGNACTADSCDEGEEACLNTPIDCNDGNACTTDSCNPATGCSNVVKNCNDFNQCTLDSCVDGVCKHVPEKECIAVTFTCEWFNVPGATHGQLVILYGSSEGNVAVIAKNEVTISLSALCASDWSPFIFEANGEAKDANGKWVNHGGNLVKAELNGDSLPLKQGVSEGAPNTGEHANAVPVDEKLTDTCPILDD